MERETTTLAANLGMSLQSMLCTRPVRVRLVVHDDISHHLVGGIDVKTNVTDLTGWMVCRFFPMLGELSLDILTAYLALYRRGMAACKVLHGCRQHVDDKTE